jgi:hypothetical protein
MSGIRSQWNDEVNISDAIDSDGNPAFRARMGWDRSITIHQDYPGAPDLLGSLIHKIVHTASEGMDRHNFEANRGYEEGVVEAVTRLFGPDIVLSIVISWSSRRLLANSPALP